MPVAAPLSTSGRNIARHGFNSVRFPFSVWMTGQTAPVPDQYLAANRDLRGSTPMQVYDACVRALTDEDLIVIPNCHLLDFGWCCSNTDENGLWFNDRWSEAQFSAAWQQMTERFRSNRLVAAMDIKNEPRQATVGGRVLEPTWGTGDQTDFAAMYTAVGNLIHQIDPHPLIICEGLSYAGDLTGVARHPVRLERPRKVVYSMHDYPWFHADGLAPLWIGPDPRQGFHPGHRSAAVQLGRPRALRPAHLGLARRGEPGRHEDAEVHDQAAHRSGGRK
jgi:endoglucanase